jgi:hypothetical protein
MHYPEGTILQKNHATVVATAEANEFGDTIFVETSSNLRCVRIGGEFYREHGAADVRKQLSKDTAPIVLSVLRTALRAAREAMTADELALFLKRRLHLASERIPTLSQF